MSYFRSPSGPRGTIGLWIVVQSKIIILRRARLLQGSCYVVQQQRNSVPKCPLFCDDFPPFTVAAFLWPQVQNAVVMPARHFYRELILSAISFVAQSQHFKDVCSFSGQRLRLSYFCSERNVRCKWNLLSEIPVFNCSFCLSPAKLWNNEISGQFSLETKSLQDECLQTLGTLFWETTFWK